MHRVRCLVLLILLLGSVAVPCAGRCARVPLKVGIVRNPAFEGPGSYLPDSLKKLKIPYEDVTEKFSSAEPTFEGITVLIIESFALSDPAIAKAFSVPKMKGLVEAFTLQGGIVIEFPQLVSKEQRVSWLPRDRTAVRVDIESDHIFVGNRDYRLFRSVSTKLVNRKLLVSPEYKLAPTNGFTGWAFFHTFLPRLTPTAPF